MYSWLKPATSGSETLGMCTVAAVREVLDGLAHDLVAPLSRGWCSSTTICSESPTHAFGLDEMSFVWKWSATSASPWKMHWTSTTIASTAPVSTASSWWSMLPAGGTPLRMSDSLAVQQMPATLMPSAPTVSASSIISGSRVASMIIDASSGSWPWMRMLTLSSDSTPRFAEERTGCGVP